MKRGLLLSCLMLCGCAGRQAARVVIPSHCMRITVTSFTKPCEDTKDGSMICDRVKVKVNCTAIEAGK